MLLPTVQALQSVYCFNRTHPPAIGTQQPTGATESASCHVITRDQTQGHLNPTVNVMLSNQQTNTAVPWMSRSMVETVEQPELVPEPHVGCKEPEREVLWRGFEASAWPEVLQDKRSSNCEPICSFGAGNSTLPEYRRS